jgi:hypothetical protein
MATIGRRSGGEGAVSPAARNARNISFVKIEGDVLAERVGEWFRGLFWAVGAFSLFAAALGIVDYTSRLAADVVKAAYRRDAIESKLYSTLVWGRAGS